MVFRYWYEAGAAKVIKDVTRVISYSSGMLEITRAVPDGLQRIILTHLKEYTRFSVTLE